MDSQFPTENRNRSQGPTIADGPTPDPDARARSPARRGRRGSLRARRAERAGSGIEQQPWRNLRNPWPPTEIVSTDELEAIHDASMTILEEIGMDFLLPEAREILGRAGADVESGSERVRFDRAMIAGLVAKAPAEFTLHARNPARNVHIGGNSVVFCPISSPPNASDIEGGRRVGNRTDFRNFLRLTQFFNILHVNAGYPVEPQDIHASVRHLECIRDVITLTDKVGFTYSLGRERVMDGFEMNRIGRGIPAEQFRNEASLFTVINASSPLRLDHPMLTGIIEFARYGQMTVITPFTLAGAMAPVTLAGALAQQNAEALAGIALSQAVRPGAPVVYGGFTSNVDMKSGAPAFGTPEYMKAAIVGGQLARRYDLPYRTSSTNASNCVDAQAAWESVFSLWGAITGGVNFLKHGAGWLEGGLVASFEKMIIDVDLLQMVAEFLRPLDVNDDTLALDAVREVGPGGHFFGCAHTQARYDSAFYPPIVSDWRNFETWQEAGAETATQRANGIYRQALDEYEAPPLDPAVREELDAFVERRIAEGGVPTDF